MKYLPFEASAVLFAFLRDIHGALSFRSQDASVLPVIQALLDLYEAASDLQERDQVVHGLVLSICPLRANGLGDAVVWPACRRHSLHCEAETLTTITNGLRSQLCSLEREPRGEAMIRAVESCARSTVNGHVPDATCDDAEGETLPAATCVECGDECEDIVGTPSGSEICLLSFNKGVH